MFVLTLIFILVVGASIGGGVGVGVSVGITVAVAIPIALSLALPQTIDRCERRHNSRWRGTMALVVVLGKFLKSIKQCMLYA